MFTGIIETLGKVKGLEANEENLKITIESEISKELKIDQSVSHNGVCLTVENIKGDEYSVTAIKETLLKSNIGQLQKGDTVNLERGMKLGARLDGHIVQGHVDQIAKCKSIKEEKGSWLFTFTYDTRLNNITIEKGSITVNGVSLTVVNSKVNEFSVAIIPYTFERTNFKSLNRGEEVNLEFDVVGKYVKRLLEFNQLS